MRGGRLFPGLLAVVATWALGDGAAAQDGTGDSAREAEVVDPNVSEEVQEALQVLDEAGVPPTTEDWRRLLTSSPGVADPTGRETGTVGFPVRGRLQVRAGRLPGRVWDRYLRLELLFPRGRLRTRLRQLGNGAREATGSLEVGTGPVEACLGLVGMTHGFGLLAGAPGRGASLTADAALGAPRERVVTWVGTADPRTLAGAGIGVRLGIWSLQGIYGRPGPLTGDGGPGRGLLRLACAGDDWRLALAVSEGALAKGLSLAGGLKRGPFFGDFESLFRQPAPGLPPTGAGLARIGWRWSRRGGLEMLLGMANLPRGAALASRHPVLPGWSSQGFAFRATGVLNDGLRVRGLIYLGEEPDRTGLRGTEDHDLLDIQAIGRVASRTQVLVRFRRRGRIRREWSERYPWQPAAVVTDESREVGTLQLNRDGSRLSWGAMVRTYGLHKEAGGGRRGLMSLTFRFRPDNSWRFRVNWGSAWGDPVDLVSAVSPLTGLVLPRHWGHWRSETVLGVEKVWRFGRFQTAASWRIPEVASDPRMDTEKALSLWFEAEFRW